jgi:hypothetical protein
MPSQLALIICARSIASSYPNMSLDDRFSFLKEMYDQTLEVPVNWTLNSGYGTNLDALQKGRWLRKNGVPGGTSVAAEGTSWCGIFATYCLQAIGVSAKWRLNVGINTPMLEKRAGYYHSDEIGPGDICVVKENQHHFIVHRRIGQKLYSYDGNLPGQMIGERDYDVDTLMEGVKKQAAYDQSPAGKLSPQASKYSFYFYRML